MKRRPSGSRRSSESRCSLARVGSLPLSLSCLRPLRLAMETSRSATWRAESHSPTSAGRVVTSQAQQKTQRRLQPTQSAVAMPP